MEDRLGPDLLSSLKLESRLDSSLDHAEPPIYWVGSGEAMLNYEKRKCAEVAYRTAQFQEAAE